MTFSRWSRYAARRLFPFKTPAAKESKEDALVALDYETRLPPGSTVKMNAGQRTARRVAARNGILHTRPAPDKARLTDDLPAKLSRDTVCSFCLHYLPQPSRRHAATAAAISETSEPSLPPPSRAPREAATAPSPQKAFTLRASTVVSRPPVLTRDLTPFEKSFYLYQKRLNERLVLPFTRYFYYKKGTPADLEWKRKYKVRRTAARDIGVYDAYSDEGWNDEVLVGDQLREPLTTIDALVRDAEGRPIVDLPESPEKVEALEPGQQIIAGSRDTTKLEVEKPASRVTGADEAGDLASLNRKLDRTLYLVVKNEEGVWRFPEDRVYGKESLRQVSQASIRGGGRVVLTSGAGRRETADPILRHQYEHLGRCQSPYWMVHGTLPQARSVKLSAEW